MNFSIIAAIDNNRGIGIGNKLPWHLKGDMNHYRAVTTTAEPGTTNAVIMGRTTWESLPEKYRPQPDRINVILTRRRDMQVPDGVLVAASLDEALDMLSGLGAGLGEVFVIGGASVYNEAINHPSCQKVILTEIDKEFDCDVFFPILDVAEFSLVSSSEPVLEAEISYRYCIYQKK